MSKLKKPTLTATDYGVIIPAKPILGDESVDDVLEDDEDEDDDEFDSLSEEGLTLAVEDLSVLDFFAGLIASQKVRSGDAGTVARESYELAKALCRERARIEST